MHGLKNVLVSLAFSTTLISHAAAAGCSAKAEQTSTDSWITVSRDGEELALVEKMQCVVPTDPNMIDAGLEHKVAMFLSCDGPTNIAACSIDYGDLKGIEGPPHSGPGWSECEVTFNC